MIRVICAIRDLLARRASTALPCSVVVLLLATLPTDAAATSDAPPRRAGPAQSGAPRPNVLFLLTDDQREDTIHALGNPHV